MHETIGSDQGGLSECHVRLRGNRNSNPGRDCPGVTAYDPRMGRGCGCSEHGPDRMAECLQPVWSIAHGNRPVPDRNRAREFTYDLNRSLCYRDNRIWHRGLQMVGAQWGCMAMAITKVITYWPIQLWAVRRIFAARRMPPVNAPLRQRLSCLGVRAIENSQSIRFSSHSLRGARKGTR